MRQTNSRTQVLSNGILEHQRCVVWLVLFSKDRRVLSWNT